MEKSYKLFYLFGISLFLSGCCLFNRTTKSSTVSEFDSVSNRTVYHLDTLNVPASVASLVFNTELITYPVTSRNGRATVTVKSNPDGTFTATANCDSLQQIIASITTENFILRQKKEANTNTVTVAKKPWWTYYLLAYAALLTVLLLLWLAGSYFSNLLKKLLPYE